MHILGGLILPVWGTVEKALSKQVRMLLLISNFSNYAGYSIAIKAVSVFHLLVVMVVARVRC